MFHITEHLSITKLMNNTPVISVVMATYNGEMYIAEAIESILNQSYKDFEFIIVDDGSTDNTANVIYKFTDERIVYIKKDTNSGIADSLNLGIAKSKGNYIARMDDDDISLPERFSKQLACFKNNQDIIACSTSGYSDDIYINRGMSHDELLNTLLFYNPILHPSVMCLRDFFIQNKYDSNFVPTEDYEIWSRIIFKGKFLQIDDPLIIIRSRKNSVTTLNRRLQLQHTITICNRIYNKTGLKKLKQHNKFYNSLVSNNYQLKPEDLSKLLIWVEDLKKTNEYQAIFKIDFFNSVIDGKTKRFLISYFKNNVKLIKIKSFFFIPKKYKIIILTAYLKKIKYD